MAPSPPPMSSGNTAGCSVVVKFYNTKKVLEKRANVILFLLAFVFFELLKILPFCRY